MASVEVAEPSPEPAPDLGPAPEPTAEAPRRRRVAPWVALGVALVLGLLVFAIARSTPGSGDTADTPLLGQAAPPIDSTTVTGQPFQLADRRGSWVVLNFFATWCPPCLQEHPELVVFSQRQGPQLGAELVSVVNNDTDENVAAFFEEEGGDWPVVRDPDGRVAVGYGIAKVPETWIIDPDGKVAARVITTVTSDFLGGLVQELQRARAAA